MNGHAMPEGEPELHPDERAFPMDQAEARIAELAKLSQLDYERRRQTEAEALALRVSALDKMVANARPKTADDDDAAALETAEPWPQSVDGLALVEEIESRLRAYVVFGAHGDATVATLWIIGTYLMDVWRLWPKMMINSPTKQCGKSTLLEVLDALVSKGLIVANMRSAGVFRAIDAWQPCLLLDEADTWMKQDDELAGIINSGHSRRQARVIRVVERNGELVPVMFSTWCAMAIAGIGSQRDTIMSRSVIISLRRRLSSESAERLPFDLHERSLDLRRQLARWAEDHKITLCAMPNEPPVPCGNDRRRDNFTPLYRIARVLGGDWPDKLLAAYVTESSEDDEEPAGIMLLRDMMAIFERRRVDRLQSYELVADLSEMEERPWAEWKQGRPLTPQSISRLLRPFEIRPRNAKIGGHVLKAYHRADVSGAHARYVAAPPPEKPLPRYQIENVGEGVAGKVAGSG